MKPQYQTILNGPSDVPEERGDCYRACMATVLDFPIEHVPHFLAIEGDGWWDAVQEFVGRFGLRVESIDVGERPEYRDLALEDTFWIASVVSPRNPEFNHCVVCLGGVVVHDPWPFEPRISGALDRSQLRVIEWFTAANPAVATQGFRMAASG